MNIDEIRSELMSQHADLRRMIEDVRGALRVTDAQAFKASEGELRARVTELARALQEHNRREEALLGEILPTIDAWGQVRREIMDEQHAEHGQLIAALVSPDTSGGAAHGRDSSTIPLPPGDFLLATLARVLDHMEREEKAFLNEALLRDDGIVTDQFSG